MLNALKQIGKSICYVALYFGMQMVVSLAATFLGSIIYLFILLMKLEAEDKALAALDVDAVDQMVMDSIYNNMGLLIVISGILTILFLWVFFTVRKKKFRAETNIRPFALKYWPGVLIGSVGLCLFVNFGMQLLPIPEDVLAEYAESSAGLMEGPFIMLLLSNAIMAPLVEEILFRGLVFGRLKKAMPMWLALVLSSVIFGLMHGQILWICYTTLVGLVLGLAAWKTDSILAPMFMHFAFNLFGTCLGCFVEEVTVGTSLILAIVGGVCTVVAVVMLWPRKCAVRYG